MKRISMTLTFLAALLAAGCVGSPAPEPAPEPVAAAPVPAATAPVAPAAPWVLPSSPVVGWSAPKEPGPYMATNLATMETRTLSNGIPVIIKRNPANRIFTLKVAFRGGAAIMPVDKAGIEAMTLALMARGSERFAFADLKRIQYEKSSSIGYYADGYDWTSFNLNTIDKYWDEMFDVFLDCLMKPSFASSQFNLVQNDARVALQKRLADQYEYTVFKLHEKMFAGHPYAQDLRGTAASIAAITLDDVKAWYADKLVPDRMVIVAVGNFDVDQLMAKLEATVGVAPRKGLAVPDVPRYVPQATLILEKFDKARGVSYVRGDYPLADPDSPDFVTMQLANQMLGELMTAVIRTDHGASYGQWGNAHAFRNPYGSLVVYKTDKPSDVKLWLDECIALLASGRTLNLGGGEGSYAPMAGTIEAYKAKYINGFFGNQQTNADVATQIIISYMTYDDPTEYLRFIDKIKAIRPEDVVAAVKAYLVGAPVTWMVCSDSTTLAKVNKDNYARFTGTVE